MVTPQDSIPYKRVFMKTIVLTTFIFIIGILVGYSVDFFRSSDVLETVQQSELDTQSYLIEQEFFNTQGGYNCAIAQKRLGHLAEELGELGYYLVSFEEKNLFKQKEYDYLLRKYVLLQIKTYAQFIDIKNQCSLQHNLILYFFDPNDVLSERQGKVLDVLVKKDTGLSVFAINIKYEGDILLETLKTHYNVTLTPTLIINEKMRKEGFVSKEELETVLA